MLTSIIHQSTKDLLPLQSLLPRPIARLPQTQIDRDLLVALVQEFCLVWTVRQPEPRHQGENARWRALDDKQDPPGADTRFGLRDTVRQRGSVCIGRC